MQPRSTFFFAFIAYNFTLIVFVATVFAAAGIERI